MRRSLGTLLFAAATMACAETPPAGRAADSAAPRATIDPVPSAATTPVGPPALTAEGWGPLRVGMSRAAVVAALGEDANPEAVGGPEPERCDEFRPARAPAGLMVMIEDGRLTRVSLDARSRDTTASGIRAGDPVARVLAAAGAAAVRTPHKYSAPPAEYITVWTQGPDGPDARGVLHDIGIDGRVTHVRGGGPSIAYVEGCL